MNRTATRLLRLLGLLQSGRAWSGAALSERLEVDRRTVRRDIDRLRDLGYAVHASSGPGGGYRFGAGRRLPPLLLDDDEAVAVMVALRTGAGGLSRMEETAAAVRLKLGQILPDRLRARLDALEAMIVPLGEWGPSVEPQRVTRLATACRDRRRLSFTYCDAQGRTRTRRVEPIRLAQTGRRWYLVAWDVDRDDWRLFRVDRMVDEPTLGAPAPERVFPGDIADYVHRCCAVAPCLHTARVELTGSAEANAARVPGFVGVLEAVDDRRCTLTLGAPTEALLVSALVGLDVEFRLIEPAPLAGALAAAATRLQRVAEQARSGG